MRITLEFQFLETVRSATQRDACLSKSCQLKNISAGFPLRDHLHRKLTADGILSERGLIENAVRLSPFLCMQTSQRVCPPCCAFLIFGEQIKEPPDLLFLDAKLAP